VVEADKTGRVGERSRGGDPQRRRRLAILGAVLKLSKLSLGGDGYIQHIQRYKSLNNP
jgi:hypothetical protein